ncbi:MAG: hypothetical protein MSH10_06515 [Pygmaiobacter massiliensis]|nr:hypothetical protein [Pygmaiobacter massiliensis]
MRAAFCAAAHRSGKTVLWAFGCVLYKICVRSVAPATGRLRGVKAKPSGPGPGGAVFFMANVWGNAAPHNQENTND